MVSGSPVQPILDAQMKDIKPNSPTPSSYTISSKHATWEALPVRPVYQCQQSTFYRQVNNQKNSPDILMPCGVYYLNHEHVKVSWGAVWWESQTEHLFVNIGIVKTAKTQERIFQYSIFGQKMAIGPHYYPNSGYHRVHQWSVWLDNQQDHCTRQHDVWIITIHCKISPP